MRHRELGSSEPHLRRSRICELLRPHEAVKGQPHEIPHMDVDDRSVSIRSAGNAGFNLRGAKQWKTLHEVFAMHMHFPSTDYRATCSATAMLRRRPRSADVARSSEDRVAAAVVYPCAESVTESRLVQAARLRSAPCHTTRCYSTMGVEVGSSQAH